jgi:tetratricopeptide (TPR) repeat protein
MLPILQRANELMATGDYAGAASSFEQAARATEGHAGRRAPLLYLQAGRARIFAGQNAMGVELLERGLGLFAMRGRPRKLARVAYRIINELHQRGLTKEAQQITNYVTSLAPGINLNNVPDETAEKHPILPRHCPGCGAPIHPDDVDWIDNVTAECEYCGSPVRGEN